MDQNRSSEEGSQNSIVHQETSFEESQGAGERGETLSNLSSNPKWITDLSIFITKPLYSLQIDWWLENKSHRIIFASTIYYIASSLRHYFEDQVSYVQRDVLSERSLNFRCSMEKPAPLVDPCIIQHLMVERDLLASQQSSPVCVSSCSTFNKEKTWM